MPAKRSVQYTIRGVPLDVDQALRRKAQRRKISLNRLLTEELVRSTDIASEKPHRSLRALAGQWKDDPEFDRVLADQRKIDRELWR